MMKKKRNFNVPFMEKEYFCAQLRSLSGISFLHLLALEARNSPLRSGSNTNNITSNSQ